MDSLIYGPDDDQAVILCFLSERSLASESSFAQTYIFQNPLYQTALLL